MIRSFGISEAGSRQSNEDCFFADDELALFVVADGMGGHLAGEVASRLAVEAIENFIRRSEDAGDLSWPCGIDAELTLDGNRVRTAIYLANRRVHRAAESSEDYTGMGTTVVCALIRNGLLTIGHVGDSRLYLLRGGALEQLTDDDSWAATILAHDPRLGPRDIASHPMRNVLTNALGARENVDVHLSEHDLNIGDWLLLCSDGLHGALDATAIARVLGSAADVETAAQALVTTALERGSRDNVTALVVRSEADA